MNTSSIRLSEIPGFEDLSPTAKRAIEPGRPAQSIIFHALASPGVKAYPDGQQFGDFPTPNELDIAENAVFGTVSRSLTDILAGVPGAKKCAAVVFAREYRQRSGTVHGMHADMVFSRTGITRVGTLDAKWDGSRRAYMPDDPDDKFALRVLPCRYAAYVAVQSKGDPSDFGPFRFDRGLEVRRELKRTSATAKSDADLDFWVPVHKLFSGSSCLKGQDIKLKLRATHVNEKLRRIHLTNMGQPLDEEYTSGFKKPATESGPFLRCQNSELDELEKPNKGPVGPTALNDKAPEEGPKPLAKFLNKEFHGFATLSAEPRKPLIEKTVRVDPTDLVGKERPIGTSVPPRNSGYLPSYFIEATVKPQGRARSAPEYTHVRTVMNDDETEKNLNEEGNIQELVRLGGYKALHYSDFTGDGWIEAQVTGLASRLQTSIAAYSIVAAPDFYPFVSQSKLLDWCMMELPPGLGIWAWKPLTLADERIPANPFAAAAVHKLPFSDTDLTVSAIVGLKGSTRTAQERLMPLTQVHLYLVAEAPSPFWRLCGDFRV